MPPVGAFEQTDLSQPWARRRALLWVVVCLVFVVLLCVGAYAQGWWHLLMAAFFVISGVRTARRLQLREPVDV